MRKYKTFLTIIAFLIPVLLLSACGKSEFGLTESTEKHMLITAKNAGRDGSFTTGSLVVDEGEKVVITSNLTKGKIRVELIVSEEEQSIEKLPDMDGEPVMTGDFSGTEEISETIPAGNYMLKGTCIERATGTITIEVKPAD